jgi:TatD DNase family protein
MKLIDTHAHLQFKAYDDDREEVAKRNSKELEAVVNVGTSVDASEKGVRLAEKFDNFYATVSVHPHHIDQWNDKTLGKLKSLGENKKVVAVGEAGLDRHLYKNYPPPDLKAQAKIFDEQLNLAVELGKPFMFHCRDAYGELYEQIKQYKGTVGGVVHCYIGNWAQAKEFLDLGLYISFTGNLTYKGNNHMREVAQKLPKERILIETDSPFLSPQGRRGMRNEPIYVKMVAAQIAILRNWSVEETGAITTENAKELLKLRS